MRNIAALRTPEEDYGQPDLSGEHPGLALPPGPPIYLVRMDDPSGGHSLDIKWEKTRLRAHKCAMTMLAHLQSAEYDYAPHGEDAWIAKHLSDRSAPQRTVRIETRDQDVEIAFGHLTKDEIASLTAA